MNKKGVSLAELLAVVVIMGIIAAIAIPLVGNVISSTKEKAKDATVISYADSLRVFQITKNLPDDVKYQVMIEDPEDEPNIFTCKEAGIAPQGTNDFKIIFDISDNQVSRIVVSFDGSGTTYTWKKSDNQVIKVVDE